MDALIEEGETVLLAPREDRTDRRVIVKTPKTGPLSADWRRIRRVRRRFGALLLGTHRAGTLTLPNLREARAAEALIRERMAP